MKRFTVLAVSLLVLVLGACTSSASSPVESAPTTTAPQFDKLTLPDGSLVALGDPIDGRFWTLQGGVYNLKSAFAVTVLAPAGKVVGIVSVKSRGGEVSGFAYGTTPDKLGSGFVATHFGGRSAYSKDFPGGTFFAVQDGCPADGLNLVAIVAYGFKSDLEATVRLQACDPTHKAD